MQQLKLSKVEQTKGESIVELELPLLMSLSIQRNLVHFLFQQKRNLLTHYF
jgi:hypothetical protein